RADRRQPERLCERLMLHIELDRPGLLSCRPGQAQEVVSAFQPGEKVGLVGAAIKLLRILEGRAARQFQGHGGMLGIPPDQGMAGFAGDVAALAEGRGLRRSRSRNCQQCREKGGERKYGSRRGGSSLRPETVAMGSIRSASTPPGDILAEKEDCPLT